MSRVKNIIVDASYGGKSDIPFEPKPDVDLAEGLLKTLDQKKTIEEFEIAKGIVAPPTPKSNLRYKSIMLDMDKSKDRELFETMMNDEKYNITSMDKNWTSLGRYRAFIIYTENLNNTQNG